jgi:GNAT superfamily N-acetyltransferase
VPRPRVERLHTYARPTQGVVLHDRTEAYELLEATPQLLDEARAGLPAILTDRKHAILADRLAGGVERVFLARDADGTWLGWSHMVRGSGPNTRIHHTLRLRPDEVYLYDDAVDPRQRRRGVHTFMILRRMELAAQEGCTRAVTTITDRNRPSIRSYKKLGFEGRSSLFHLPALGRSVELPLRPSWLRLPAAVRTRAARGR